MPTRIRLTVVNDATGTTTRVTSCTDSERTARAGIPAGWTVTRVEHIAL
jgi:hypothetical protein